MLVAASFIFVAYQMIVRIFFGVMLTDVINIFDISISQVGVVAGIYYFSFACSSIVTSILYMRYNFLLIMNFGLLSIIVGLACFLLPCFGVYSVVVGRLLIGWGSGMSLPLYLQVFSMFYDAENRKIMVNYVFLNCMITLSIVLFCFKPQYALMYDYYDLLYVFIFIGIVLNIYFFYAYYRYEVRIEDNSITFSDILKFISDKKIIFLGVICGLLAGTPDAFSDLWSLMFLEKCCNMPNSELIMIFFWLFYAVAGFIIKYIYSCINVTVSSFIVYISFMLLGLYCILFGMLYFDIVFIYKDESFYILKLVISLLAICCGYKPFLFGNAGQFIDRRFAILGVVIINSSCMFFGQLFHTSIGCAMDVLIVKLPIKLAYIYALSIIPVCIIISIILCIYNKHVLEMKKINK